MKKTPVWQTGYIVLAVCAVLFALLFVSPYNKITALAQSASAAQSNVQAALQARVDKIEEMGAVIDSLNIQQDLDTSSSLLSGDADVKELEEAQNTSNEAVQALKKSLAASSSQTASDFLTSLEGQENRISYAWEKYNAAAAEYNTYISKFPNSLCAKMFHFLEKETFQS